MSFLENLQIEPFYSKVAEARVWSLLEHSGVFWGPMDSGVWRLLESSGISCLLESGNMLPKMVTCYQTW